MGGCESSDTVVHKDGVYPGTLPVAKILTDENKPGLQNNKPPEIAIPKKEPEKPKSESKKKSEYAQYYENVSPKKVKRVKKKKKRGKVVEVQSFDDGHVEFDLENCSPDARSPTKNARLDHSQLNLQSPSKILQSSRVIKEYNKNSHLPIEEQVREVS